nr:salivary His rich peptide [Homo sapiens]prf//1918385A His-rich peptide [Homo sapiens]
KFHEKHHSHRGY